MQPKVLISGASKGIGLAIAKKFLENGFMVIGIARSKGDASEWLEKHPDNFFMYHADLTSKEETIMTGNKILEKHGNIDVLVNNAGTFIPGQIHSEEDGVFELMMSLNVSAAYHLTRAVISSMIGRDSYIFNICSTASVMPYVNGGSYCISKHAILGLSKVLRQEMIGRGVSVSSVLPGATRTESWNGTDLPDNRFISPDSIAEAIFSAWSLRENCVFEEVLIRPVLGDI